MLSNIECAGSITDIVGESVISEPSSNLGLIYCIPFRNKVFEKCTNRPLLHSPTSYGLNTEAIKDRLRRIPKHGEDNGKPFYFS